MMIYRIKAQHGTALIVSLVMLVVMTLLAITSINMSTVNLRIVGNMQAQMEAEAAVQTAIEGVIGDLNNFITPATAPVNVTVADYTVRLEAPLCVLTAPSAGYEATYSTDDNVAGVRFDNDWILRASNTAGAIGGEFAENTQGVRVRAVLTPCP